MNLIFDLDGTLIDARLRLYTLFQELVPECELGFEAYWDLKRANVSNEDILQRRLGFGSGRLREFRWQWMALIESPTLLALDTLIPGVSSALPTFARVATLYVCTNRQRPKAATDQLDQLGILDYFKAVMVTSQLQTKRELIAEIPGLDSRDWFLSDSGVDIRVGNSLGMKTCAVLSGFSNEVVLSTYRPDLIVASASRFQLTPHLNGTDHAG